MAVHSYSFLDLKTAVLAAAGTTTLASTLDTGDIVNDALVYLSGLREWRWLRSALTLNVTADQNYVPLPADFGQMQALSGASGSYAAVRWIDVEELIWLRQYASQTADGVQAVAVSWTSQTSASVLPLGRLEIYPTPSANETGALTGLYTKLVRKLEQDTDVPNVPGYCHPPLKRSAVHWRSARPKSAAGRCGRCSSSSCNRRSAWTARASQAMA